MMPYPRKPNKPISQELADLLAHRLIKRVERVRHGNWVCWERTTCIHPITGYSNVVIKIDGKPSYFFAHRVMYTHYNGPFPAELTIDHLCENPACCNPKHLRAVTHAENVLRSRTNPTAIHARRTQCVNGHPLPPRSLKESVKRKCLTCHAEGIRRRAKARAERGLPEGDARHGTSAGYGYWRCRCELCKAWQRGAHLTRKAAA